MAEFANDLSHSDSDRRSNRHAGQEASEADFPDGSVDENQAPQGSQAAHEPCPCHDLGAVIALR